MDQILVNNDTNAKDILQRQIEKISSDNQSQKQNLESNLSEIDLKLKAVREDMTQYECKAKEMFEACYEDKSQLLKK